MKKILLTFTLFVFIATNLKSQDFKELYFKFEIKNKSELKDLTKIISIDNVQNNTVYAYSNDKDFYKFEELGYSYTFIDEPKATKAEMAATTSEMANWDKFPTYDLYVEMLNAYETNYPDICKVVDIGTTVNGRNLLVLRISDNVNIEENEPEFFYTSTMHGDETTGYVLMLRLIDSLVTNYGSVPEITNLVNDIEIYINPNANPDGTYRSDNSTISYATRANGNGIDLNRNFPDPTHGLHPDNNNWQPETEAMMDFATKHRFVVSANFHGGIELANYPWDHTYRRHTDDDWFIRVSRDYATSCQNNSPSGYFTAENNGITNGADWYVVYGSRQDYYVFNNNSREITLEISDVKTVSASTLPDYWNYNKDGLFQLMRECLYGIKGTVKDINGNPLDAMIQIEDYDNFTDSSIIFTDPDIGDYHRVIEPGTYNVIASAKGFTNDTINNVTFTSKNSVIANFILERSTIAAEVTPSLIDETLNLGSSSEHYLLIKNIGTETLEYTTSIDLPTKSDSWLTLNKENGSINVNDTDTIYVNLTGNNIGSHTAILTIQTQNGINYEIPVNLYVQNIQSVNDIKDFSNLKINPNPFKDQFEIELFSNQNSNIDIVIYSVSGIKIFEKNINLIKGSKNNININLSEFGSGNLQNGIYLIQIISEKSAITKRILKY
ncbi:MAG: T9SS type A sorting domain-containing protein [Bacteroidales bacterium]|nr:T9SS type A sorting domain-containing protein [Bacteroidales bacterium]